MRFPFLNKLPFSMGKPIEIKLEKIQLVDPEWLPDVKMKRIILHWTAGANIASDFDKEHYHLLVEQTPGGSARVVRGKFPISANTPPLVEGEYAAHTLRANSYAIGVSLCGMAGAVESPFRPGPSPITKAQWEKAIELVSFLCKTYSIEPTRENVLSHAEVEKTLKIKQRQKWDISRLPFDPSLVGATAVGDALRAAVAERLR